MYQQNSRGTAVGPLFHQGTIKDDRKTAERLNDLLALVFAIDNSTILRLLLTGNEAKYYPVLVL